jgi:hypothetical protein
MPETMRFLTPENFLKKTLPKPLTLDLRRVMFEVSEGQPTRTKDKEMTTEMITLNWDSSNPCAPVIGKTAIFTTWDNERLIGTVAKKATDGAYPRIEFADGTWARLADTVEVVVA